MKIKFFTLGCKVNQYETQGLIDKFLSLGCRVTDGKADLYIINTCTVTSRADSKSRGAVLAARKENPSAKIAVCGCFVRGNEKIIEKLKVDYVIPQEKKYLLPEIIFGNSYPDGFSSQVNDNWSLKIKSFFNERAFVKVQDGCNNFCSFCKIPYLRGPARSRGQGEVIDEIERLSHRHNEIVVCGTNISLYGRDLNPPSRLEYLVENILNISSLKRLRLSSLEPLFVNDKILSFLNNRKFCPHLHFPFQHGDDKVLKAMGKKETVSLYEEIAFKARKINPAVAISCDIITGFPDEDDKSFRNTLEFLNRIRPMRMHIFTFSPRERTPLFGTKIKNKETVRKRYEILKETADRLSLQYKENFLGRVLFMVAEDEKNGFISGYTENYIKVYVKEKIQLGKIFPVKIDKISVDRVLASLAE